MRKLVVILFFAPFLAWSQEITINDTLAIANNDAAIDSLNNIPKDTIKSELVSIPSNLDFAPADDTPELIADRLACLQNTIELTYNSRVHGFIEYFTVRDREYTRNMLRKKDLYFPLFERYLKQYHLPDELKYLSIIESALSPRAVSRARAVGLWQFMSGTGRYFGLKNDWYFDDRMDPDKATEAACQYLSQLHSIFGDWQLALAAYNSGPGTVRLAVRRSGYKKTFWEVYPYLPRETRSYVPQFIAMVYAINFASEHNIFEDGKEQVIPHDTISVKQFVHLETLAKLTGTCLEEIQNLNPRVLRVALPDNGQTHILKLPIASKQILEANRQQILDSASKGKQEFEALAKQMAGNTYGREKIVYRVQSGDALSIIARKFGVSVRDIKEWNYLSRNTIRAGQNLNIWLLPSQSKPKAVSQIKQDSAKVAPEPIDTTIKTYIVQPGDTLWDISKKIGASVQQIKNLNKLKSSKLQPGMKLIVG
jgi:membrane-bound lytic murein transglycosylase D